MNRPRILAAALCCAALGGCKTTLDSVARDLTGRNTYEGVSGRFIDVAQERQTTLAEDNVIVAIADALPGKPQAAASDRKATKDKPVGVWEDGAAALNAYMGGVLSRLLAQWPYEPPKAINVVLADTPGYGATSYADGTIAVSRDFFVYCESEDELAFMLAHEASHVLLRHHIADRHMAAQRKLEAATAEALMLALSHKDPSNPKLRQGNTRAYLATQAYSALRTALLDPAWNRQQEDDADMLALDLVTAAGYNNTAYDLVFDRLADIEQQAHEREDSARRATTDDLDAVAAENPVAGFSMAFQRMGNGPSVLLTKIFTEVGKQHASAKGRRQNLDGYAEREAESLMDGGVRPMQIEAYQAATLRGPGSKLLLKRVAATKARALLATDDDAEAEKLLKSALDGPKDTDAELRLTLHDLRRKQGRNAEAHSELDAAFKDPMAQRPVYMARVRDHGDDGNWTHAIEAIDTMEARFGGHEENLPMRLEYLIKAGKTGPAKATAQECAANPNLQLQESCQAVVARNRTTAKL